MIGIGKRVRKARQAAGLTQLNLAKKAHISQSYIAGIENDAYNPSIDVLMSITTALRVDIAELIGNVDTIQATGLNTDEIDLVIAYRRLSDDNKKLTKTMVYKLAPPKALYSNRNKTRQAALIGG